MAIRQPRVNIDTHLPFPNEWKQNTEHYRRLIQADSPMSWADHPNVLPHAPYDQGQRDTCTYVAVCTALAAQYYIRTREVVRLSPESILYGVRQEKCALLKIEPSTSELLNDRMIIEHSWPEYAATMDDALSYAARFGVATEQDWPYDADTPPSGNNIAVLKIQDYEILFNGTQIKKYLREYPLICQMEATPTFCDKLNDDSVYSNEEHGIFPPSPDRCHTMVLIGWGYKDSCPVWIILNSWGVEWGRSGIGYIQRVEDDHSEDLGILMRVARASILPPGFYPANRRVPRLLGLPRDRYRHQVNP